MQLLSQYMWNSDHKSGGILDSRETMRDGTSLLPSGTSEMRWWSWSRRVGAVQWLRFCTFNAGSSGSIPGLRTKIPPAMQPKKKKNSLLWSSGWWYVWSPEDGHPPSGHPCCACSGAPADCWAVSSKLLPPTPSFTPDLSAWTPEQWTSHTEKPRSSQGLQPRQVQLTFDPRKQVTCSKRGSHTTGRGPRRSETQGESASIPLTLASRARAHPSPWEFTHPRESASIPVRARPSPWERAHPRESTSIPAGRWPVPRRCRCVCLPPPSFPFLSLFSRLCSQWFLTLSWKERERAPWRPLRAPRDPEGPWNLRPQVSALSCLICWRPVGARKALLRSRV